MNSVYKLTKYSQKITEACQKKQYEKISLYNKHENLYIKKLNEYFCNQKGGANLEELQAFFGAMQRNIETIISDRDSLDVKFGECFNRLQEVEKGRDEAQVEIARLQGENRSVNDENDNLRRQASEKLDSAAAAVAAGSNEQTAILIRQLQETINSLEEQVESLKRNGQREEALITELQQKNRKAVTEKDALAAKNQELTARIEAFTAEKQALEQQIATHQSTISSLTAEVGEASQQVQQLQQQRGELELANATITAEKDVLINTVSQVGIAHEAAIEELNSRLEVALSNLRGTAAPQARISQRGINLGAAAAADIERGEGGEGVVVTDVHRVGGAHRRR